MRIKKLDIFWCGWRELFDWPWITWGSWHPELQIASYKYLIIGPIEFRKWKVVDRGITIQNLDKDFWADE
jgi:hypothetical protein